MKKLLATIGLILVVGSVLAGDRNRWEADGLGGYDIYNSNGERIGRADDDLLGGYDIYDRSGERIGRADSDLIDGYDIYDRNGKRTGHLDPEP